MADKQVIIKRKSASAGYDVLYPQTNIAQVTNLQGELDGLQSSIDAVSGGHLPLAGGTLTGALTLPASGVLHSLRYNFTSGQALSRKWFVANDAYAYGTFDISTETAQGNNTLLSRLHINKDGNIGIGTTSPFGILNIRNNTNITNASTINNYSLLLSRFEDANSNNETGIAFRISSAQASTSTPGAAITHLREGTNSAGSLLFKTNQTTTGTGALSERMRITSGGDVGIGTTSPNAKLEVNGTLAVNGRAMVFNNTATISTNTSLSGIHRGATIFCTNSTAITITVPADASNVTFPPGTEITFIRRGAGTVTIATTNISLFSVGSGTANAGRRSIANRNEGVILIKETANTWQLIGAL